MQDEEDRELQEAFEKTAFSLYADEFDMSPEEMEMQRDRILSLGNVNSNLFKLLRTFQL